MMKSMKKQSWLILLAAAIFLSLLPLQASAATITTHYVDHDGTFHSDVPATEISSSSTVWSTGWYVVNSNVDISSNVLVSGNANLILADGCQLQTKKSITLNNGTSLTIYGQTNGTGKLVATKYDDNYPSIGINPGLSGGSATITINGGNVNATGGIQSAGIGTGFECNNTMTITINGGSIVATGGNWGAGIGTGYKCSNNMTITINGGTVEAQGSYYSAGIGTGNSNSSGNVTININGGIITANGYNSAGIGAGGHYKGSLNITIDGGTITANSVSGAGIGSGWSNSTSATITINGGTITATSENGADIGKGEGTLGNINTTIDRGNCQRDGGRGTGQWLHCHPVQREDG